MKAEIIAKNAQLELIQRYIDGTRFYQVRPETMKEMIFSSIRKQFKDKPVEIKESDNWIMIKKTDESLKLEKELREKSSESLTEKEMLEKEIEVLKKSGFYVQFKIIDDDNDDLGETQYVQ